MSRDPVREPYNTNLHGEEDGAALALYSRLYAALARASHSSPGQDQWALQDHQLGEDGPIMRMRS